MEVIDTHIAEVKILQPKLFGDDRGFFMESFNQQRFEAATGVKTSFVQDNHSRSAKHVLRGLHYQIQQPQGKLVRVIAGKVFDVAVDLRRSSATFGQSVSVYLDDKSHQMLWVPPGFAHGFLVISDSADFLYKTTDYYAPEHERCLRWDDAELAINWPLTQPPVLSEKDQQGDALQNAETYD